MTICSVCMKPCDTVERDFGYGVTEFWGAISCHTNIHTVSKCCDGDPIDEKDLEEIDE